MTLTLLEFGLSTAFAPTFGAMQAGLEADQSVLFRNESFFGSDFQPQLCAFRDRKAVGVFADRLGELLNEASQDFIARFASSEAAKGLYRDSEISLILLLPEVDDRSGLDKASLSSLGQALAARLQATMVEHCGFRFGRTLVRAAGTAGVGSAIADCLAELRPGMRQTVMIAAVDSYSDRQRLNRLNDQKRLFSSGNNQFGFIPGEAAGILLLTTDSEGATLLQVRGAGNFVEPTREYEEAESVFTALSDAAFAAAEAGLPHNGSERINGWIADWNNSRYRATELSFAVHRLNRSYLQQGLAPVYPMLVFGDVGAAYGCLAVILAHSRRCFETVFATDPVETEETKVSQILVSAGSAGSGLRSALLVSSY